MKELPEFNKNETTWIIWILRSTGFILFFVFFMSAFPIFRELPFQLTGALADTINGFTAPFIGVVAAVLTYMAFWVQFKANEEIRKQFKHERFETKFYELLKLHKENVSEIDIAGKYKGRKAFVWMYKEFRFIYEVCFEKLLEINQVLDDDEKLNYTKKELALLAYTIFFFGVGKTSEKGIDYHLGKFDEMFIFEITRTLENYQYEYESRENKNTEWMILNFMHYGSNETKKLELNYYPFDGHISKLGHYFRHLYQTFKVIITDDKLKLTWEEKYQYVKIIRAQLSNHEQALIYYNSFTKAGQKWWKEDTIDCKNEKGEVVSYFLDYRVIKNLPLNLTSDIGPDPKAEFSEALRERGRTDAEIDKEIKDLFEWIGG